MRVRPGAHRRPRCAPRAGTACGSAFGTGFDTLRRRKRAEAARLDAAWVDAARLDAARVEEARVEEARVDEARVDEARVDEACVDEAWQCGIVMTIAACACRRLIAYTCCTNRWFNGQLAGRFVPPAFPDGGIHC
jgi:hypothetical protein